MSVIGELRVNIVAGTQGLVQGLSRARSAVSSFASSVGKTQLGLKSALGGLGGALSLQRLGSSLRERMNEIDDMNDAAQRLKASYAGLAGLSMAAKMTGTDFGTLQTTIAKMTKNLAEVATTGKGPASEALRTIGIDIRELVGLQADRQFIKIAGALADLKDESQRTVAAYDLFGKSAGQINNVLAMGEDGLKAMEAQVKKLGLALTDFEANEVAKANDAIDNMRASIEGLKTAAATRFAPAIGDAASFAQQALSRGLPENSRAGDRVQTMSGFWRTTYQNLGLGNLVDRLETSGAYGAAPESVLAEQAARGVLGPQGSLAASVRSREASQGALQALGKVVGNAFSQTLKPAGEVGRSYFSSAVQGLGNLQQMDKTAARKLFMWQLLNPAGSGSGATAAAAMPASASFVGLNRAIESSSQEGLLALRGKPAEKELAKVAENTDDMVEFLKIIADNTGKYPELDVVSLDGGMG